MKDDQHWTHVNQDTMKEDVELVRLDQGIVIPALLADAEDETARKTVDFFTVKIRNKNTRRA